MTELVETFAENWQEEVVKQESSSKRLREILFRWGEFSSEYVKEARLLKQENEESGWMWWSLFKKFGWPVHYVALLLVLRIALISMQLSVSPNIPRLIFKISWDIIFAFGLMGLMLHVLITNY